MNKKKLFAALTSAAMLLNGAPLSVLADEMVEAESGSVPGSDVEQATTVEINEVNFPDKNFRQAVINALNHLDGDNKPSDEVAEGSKVKVVALEEILTLSSSVTNSNTPKEEDWDPNAYAPADYYDDEAKPFADLTGIEYLTGLQFLVLDNSPRLKVADLTDNIELIYVRIAPGFVAGEKDAPNTNTTPGSSDLYSLTLPKETENLTGLVIQGANQLTTLDLSNCEELTAADLQFNEISALSLEGCISLETLNVNGNDLTSLSLAQNRSLKTLIASNNNLYEIDLPNGKALTTVDLDNNKFSSIDVSGLKGLDYLTLNNNRLESIDVSSNTNLHDLSLWYNHLATLDLSNNNNLEGKVGLDGQIIYANLDDEGVDLKSYDENFQASSQGLGWVDGTVPSVTFGSEFTTSPVGGTISKDGIFAFDADVDAYNYAYETNSPTSQGKYLYVNIVKGNLMNRLYNPNSGEHFYTADLNEKDTLVKLGWQYEGIGWVAPEENTTGITGSTDSVFRLYNPNAGDHHYTADSKEKDTLVRVGWDYEGVGWYSTRPQGLWMSGNSDDLYEVLGKDLTTTTAAGYSIEVYREYNPNAKEAGAHNYTTSENENDTLVSLGWLDEGIGWYALK